ncbi:MAG TPA: glutathione S-transferase N-terminal domain-containing protein [Candidatus Polarisedimenticolia bacterium]|jgi:glutathione S-transferase|nr:glutathione S-transferase N-terminal domain-containing protein [Candidatus Polarisedimenticolia bacterium]
MSDELILYVGEKNISSWSMRAFVALSAKNLEFDERTIPLREDKDRAQRRRVSPTGRVPVLRHGDLVIPDSLAIIEYLEETFPPPAHPALWPQDRAERAHARWLAATMHSGFMKLRESMSFNLCFLKEPPRPTAEAMQEAAEMLSLLQDALDGKKAPGPFLFGPFTAADVMYATAIVRLTTFRVPTAAAPNTPAYMEAVLSHPAVKRWMDAASALPPRETY